ncbi:MAG: SIMPL domain-containing protein [Holosporaceae bacterium]|jgi:hypothetical protein|nr:SIMPL domain-containing protein [Holosporaceae bacterium]
MKCSFLSAVVIACGLVGFGFFSFKSFRDYGELVEVKGLSEKVVRADVGDVCIVISDRNSSLEELYKKRTLDKDKVIAFLKGVGVTGEEIVNCSMNTTEECWNDEMKKAGYSETAAKKQRYFKSEDKINVRTKDLDKVNKIKEELVKLSSEGTFITYSYSYQLTNFSDIKIEMMRDASENAKKNAEAFIVPHNQKIGKVVYLRQGEITIRAESEDEDTNRWESCEKTSINKKLRLIVRAGFLKTI